jgi:hypothetical protein
VKTAFLKSFERDLKNLKKDRQMLSRIQKKIDEVEEASGLDVLSSVKKLSGAKITIASALVIIGSASRLRMRQSCLCGVCIGGRYTAISRSRKSRNIVDFIGRITIHCT